jgi:hypothetical protein
LTAFERFTRDDRTTVNNALTRTSS